MKLLFLGLIIIFVLLIQVYLINKNQEAFNTNLNAAMEEGERNFLKQQDKYYDIRSQGPGAGLLKTKPGISDWVKLDEQKNLKKVKPNLELDQSLIDKKIVNCRALTKCEQLANNQCGYCAADKEFRFGDANGPTADVCPKNAWTMNANKCKELREKDICNEVKSCGDLYGEAEEICGYCPTTGKSMPMMKGADGKYFPKYSGDICPNSEDFGLLTGDKCGKFLKDHPCITPYSMSGPHSAACMKKLWRNSGCTYNRPYGRSFWSLGRVSRRPYKDIGIYMKKTNENTRSRRYDTAILASKQCYGNTKNINPCDTKYNRFGTPDPDCLKRELLQAGCSEKGWLWRNYNKRNHWVARWWNWYASKYLNSTSGWRRWSLGIGDLKRAFKNIHKYTVEADNYSTRLNTSMLCFGERPKPPPPIKNGDTVNMTDDGYKYEGIVTSMRGVMCRIMWTKSKNVTTINREGMSLDQQKRIFGWPGINPTHRRVKTTVNKSRLNMQSSCSNNKSQCKRTCKDKVREILYKFPRPRDCIVSSWGSWSSCSKSCGGGVQRKTRRVLYPAKFGGSACPTLTLTKRCNTQACLNKNFTEKTGDNLRALVKRGVNKPFKGGGNLNECEGDCDSNRDCNGNLVCYQRDSSRDVPPGCYPGGSGDTPTWDYCVNPDKPIVIIDKNRWEKPSKGKFKMYINIPTQFYLVTFNIVPRGTRSGWSNVFHIGTGGDYPRIPAVWFFSNTTRLHIRTSSRRGINDGIDPPVQLPLNKMTSVTIRVSGSRTTVTYKGAVNGTWSKDIKSSGYYRQKKRVYVGINNYNSGLCDLNSLYFQRLKN